MADLDLSLLEAIRAAQQAEQNAALMYNTAAQETENPLVRRLFEQLAEFEDMHYDKLADLAESLRARRAFSAPAEPAAHPELVTGEIGRIEGTSKVSAAKALKLAMDAETKAEERYTTLAERVSAPEVRKLFVSFAREEHKHYLVLRSAYYEISNMAIPT
jgi:rubrerythrin